MLFQTADLCDAHPDLVRVVQPMFRSFGKRSAFGGEIHTVKVFEDNVLVKQALQQPGAGRVLVVDGGGSLRCALLGDLLAQIGSDNGWAGVIIYGCIRDSGIVAGIDIGVFALATIPIKSVKRGEGQVGETASFGGVDFRSGEFVYADADGVIVSPGPIHES